VIIIIIKMLRIFNKQAIYNSRALLRCSARTYYKDDVLMPREQGDYYSDPMDVAERVVRLIALHDACRDPASVTVSHTFEQLGLNALDMCEVFIGVEREFDLEIAEETCEEMTTVNCLVEFLAKNPASK
jgi:acyl carrier protein